jgi:hypothetical protein
MDVLNKILAKLESLDGRIGQLEQQFIGKTYTFPNVGNLEKWIQDFGTTAKEARINIQLIVNVVQACGLVLGVVEDKENFPAPHCEWGDQCLELLFFRDMTTYLKIKVPPTAYAKVKWESQNGLHFIEGSEDIVSSPSEKFKMAIGFISG